MITITYTIYKLYHSSRPDKSYVGSTKESLENRLSKHKYDYTNNPSRYVYQKIRKYGGWNGVVMESITTITMEENKDAIHEIEDRYIQQFGILNSCSASKERTKQNTLNAVREWRSQNTDLANQFTKDWRERNQAHIKQYNKERVKCPVCDRDFARDSLRGHKKRAHS